MRLSLNMQNDRRILKKLEYVNKFNMEKTQINKFDIFKSELKIIKWSFILLPLQNYTIKRLYQRLCTKFNSRIQKRNSNHNSEIRRLRFWMKLSNNWITSVRSHKSSGDCQLHNSSFLNINYFSIL